MIVPIFSLLSAVTSFSIILYLIRIVSNFSLPVRFFLNCQCPGVRFCAYNLWILQTLYVFDRKDDYWHYFLLLDDFTNIRNL